MKNEFKGVILLSLGACKTIIIKTVWHWQKNRHVNQQNRVKSPEETHPKEGIQMAKSVSEDVFNIFSY